MLDDLNDMIEGLFIDVVSEGMGTTFGYILMWGMFFGGTFALFSGLMTLLAGTV